MSYLAQSGAHHLLNIIGREEIVPFVIAAFTTLGLILCHRGIVSYTGARASNQLLKKLDHLSTMNR